MVPHGSAVSVPFLCPALLRRAASARRLRQAGLNTGLISGDALPLRSLRLPLLGGVGAGQAVFGVPSFDPLPDRTCPTDFPPPQRSLCRFCNENPTEVCAASLRFCANSMASANVPVDLRSYPTLRPRRADRRACGTAPIFDEWIERVLIQSFYTQPPQTATAARLGNVEDFIRIGGAYE